MANLPSVFDDDELERVQKEPQKRTALIDELPTIPMERVVENVQQQQQQQEAQVDQLMHPSQEMMEIQDFQAIGTTETFIHEPLPVLNTVYDMAARGALDKYRQLILPNPIQLPSCSENCVTWYGNGFSFIHGIYMQSARKINMLASAVNFDSVKMVLLDETMHDYIIDTHIQDASFQLFKETKAKREQLEVFSIVYPNAPTDAYLQWFKKIFILFGIDRELEQFIGEVENNMATRRYNLTRPFISWTMRKVPQGSMLTYKLKNLKECRDCYIYKVNIPRMTVIMEIDNKRIYFQVVCTENNRYIITNLFHEQELRQARLDAGRRKHQESLASLSDSPFEFKYVRHYNDDQFETVMTGWTQQQYQPGQDEPVELKKKTHYSLEVRNVKYGRRNVVEKMWKIVDFNFTFVYPISLLEHRAVDGLNQEYLEPVYFTDQNHVSTFEPIIIYNNDWEYLRNFITTVLFPEQVTMPAPVAEEGPVDEQYVDQPTDQHTDQPVERPFDQLANQIDSMPVVHQEDVAAEQWRNQIVQNYEQALQRAQQDQGFQMMLEEDVEEPHEDVQEEQVVPTQTEPPIGNVDDLPSISGISELFEN